MMTTAERIIQGKKDLDEVLDAGKEAESRDKWNKHIDALNKSAFTYGFAGKGWNDDTFTPYTDIVIPKVTATSSLFMHTGFTDLKGIFEKYGTILDLSNSSNVTYLFSSSAVTHVPKLFFSIVNISYLFNKCTDLVSVEELVLSKPITNTTSAFLNCESLQEIRISGEIKVSLDIHYSPLSKASVESIVSALSGTASGQTVTFNEAQIETLNGDSTWWTDLKATKSNWTFALADV